MNKYKTKKEAKQKLIRKKPTENVNVVGPVHDATLNVEVGEYIESKPLNKNFTTPTNSDSVSDSIEMMYLENLSENEKLVNMQRKFLEMRTNGEDKINKNRIKNLYKTQEALKKSFIKNADFIRDCKDKERAAMVTCNKQLQLSEEITKQNAKARESIEVLKVFRDELKETVDKYQPYMKILKDVVNKSKVYNSVKDCMDHCDAMMIAQVEIENLQQTKLAEIEKMRKCMVNMSDEVALSVIGMENELASVKRGYNEARSGWKHWSTKLAKAKEVKAEMEFENLHSRRGLENIYELLRLHSHVPEKYCPIVDHMCNYIYNEYKILKETSEILKKE